MLGLAMVLAWLVFLRPVWLGGPAGYAVVSGRSMQPTLHVGDLVLTHKQGAYAAGDVVVFRVPEGEPGAGGKVIHRIVGGSADEGFVVQGDNKNAPDIWHPTKHDIVGKMWFSVPRAGYILAFLHGPLQLAGLASGFAVFLVLTGGEDEKQLRKGSPGKRPDGTREG
jgi:signal peptidase